MNAKTITNTQNIKTNLNTVQEHIGANIQYTSAPHKTKASYADTKIKEEFIVSDSVNQKVNSANYPQKKYRAGPITATIWANSFKNEKGQGNYTTVSLERIYQDKEGAWKSTNSLRINDLPKVAAVMQRAYADLLIKEQELFKTKVNA